MDDSKLTLAKDGLALAAESDTADKDGDGTPDSQDPVDNRPLVAQMWLVSEDIESVKSEKMPADDSLPITMRETASGTLHYVLETFAWKGSPAGIDGLPFYTDKAPPLANLADDVRMAVECLPNPAKGSSSCGTGSVTKTVSCNISSPKPCMDCTAPWQTPMTTIWTTLCGSDPRCLTYTPMIDEIQGYLVPGTDIEQDHLNNKKSWTCVPDCTGGDCGTTNTQHVPGIGSLEVLEEKTVAGRARPPSLDLQVARGSLKDAKPFKVLLTASGKTLRALTRSSGTFT